MMNNKMIIENTPFGVILHNSDGLIIDANKQIEQIIKVSLTEIIGKKWDELSFKVINKEGIEYSVENHPVAEALCTGKGVKDKIMGVIHPENREIIWINTTTVFKPTELECNTEQNQAIMYLSNITNIIKTTVTIESVIENLNLGTWQWDIETDVLTFNKQWAEMLGYNSIEKYSPSKIGVWHNLIHPDDFGIMEDALYAHFARKTPQYNCEIRLLHKNGKWLWVRHMGKVSIWSDSGKPLYMMGIHQNISDYKKNELILSWKLEYGKMISDISSKFIGVKNIDTTIIESFGRLGSLNHASRVYLFLVDKKKGTMSNTHEWCAKGVSAQKEILQNLSLTDFPWWIKKLSEGDIININDVSKMELEAKSEKEILEYQDVKSILVLPIKVKQKLAGFIGFDNIVSSENWSINDIDLLLTTASVFSHALERQSSEKELNKSYLNLRSYFDSNSDFVMILNEQGEIVEVNNLVKEKLGYKEEDVIGEHLLMLYSSKVNDESAHIDRKSVV